MSNPMQQLKSDDSNVIIDIVSSVDGIYTHPIPHKGDFSFVEIPENPAIALSFYSSLKESQGNSHVTLNTTRASKQKRLSTFANVRFAEQAGFCFHDFISIVTDKDAKRTPNLLHRFSETAALLHKKEELNITATDWFNGELRQATNHWMVEAHQTEKPNISTGGKFAYEVGDLVSSLASPLIHRKFLIFGVASVNHLMYAKSRGYCVYAITNDLATAKKAIAAYNSTKNK
jgi:hypothetical protein